jgi:hypothetical protein
MRILVGSGLVSQPVPTYATTFTTSLAPTSGQSGTMATYVVTPGAGGFPGGKTVQPSVSGFGAPSAQTTTAGSTTPLTFVLLVTGSGNTTATVNVAIDGMTNGTGAQQFTITQPVVVTPPTNNANKYFLIPDQSSVAPGATVTGKAYFNGLGTGGTITPSQGSALTIPSGSNTPVNFSFSAPSVTEIVLSATNSAGLYDSQDALITVFAASNGTARTLSVALGAPPGVGPIGPNDNPANAPAYRPAMDMHTFQRTVTSGTPRGFPSSFNKGWAPAWLAVSSLSGSTQALYLKLFDAFSSGATTSPGTGTELTSGAVQVYGTISANGTIMVQLPGSTKNYYADVATDAAFTNPVRIQQRFRVGEVVGIMSRSQESGVVRSFAYGGNSQPTLPANGNTNTTTLVGYDQRYGIPDGTTWYLQDGVHQDNAPYHGDWTSSGAQELGALFEQELGVCVAVVGSAASGGGFDEITDANGGPSGGFIPNLLYGGWARCRYLWINCGDLDAGGETLEGDRARQNGLAAWVGQHMKSIEVIGFCHGASGWYGQSGSGPIDHGRVQMVARDAEASNPMVVSKENTTWTQFAGSPGHSSMAARRLYVHSGVRLMRAAVLAVNGGTQTKDRGPTFAATGFIASGNVLRLPYNLNGAGALLPKGFNQNDPNYSVDTATPAEIAALFSVFPGANKDFTTATAVQISTATINTASPPTGYDGTVDLQLVVQNGQLVNYAGGPSGTQAIPSAFSVNYAIDYSTSNQSLTLYNYGAARSSSLCDDRLDMGLAYGWAMRPAFMQVS